jgi:nicotinamidase/pyrazinamidase
MDVKFNKALTASFDVDAQNTFTELCPLELPVKGGQDIVPELNAQAKFARFRVGSKDAHSPASLWVDTDKEPQLTPIANALNMDVRWKIHGVPGSAGFRLIDGLPAVRDYDFFVWKGIELDMHPYGACYHDLACKKSTGVIEWMRANGIEVVLVGGLASDFCVANTVFQLAKAKFKVIVNMGACRGIWAQTTEEELIKKFEATDGVIVVRSAEELGQYFMEEVSY